MKLVIAEKPSVAQSLARVIGATMSALPNGGWRTCRSCRNGFCTRFPQGPANSTRS